MAAIPFDCYTHADSTCCQEITWVVSNVDYSHEFRLPAWIYVEGKRFLDLVEAKKYWNLLNSRASWVCPERIDSTVKTTFLPRVYHRRYDSKQFVMNKRRFYKQKLRS